VLRAPLTPRRNEREISLVLNNCRGGGAHRARSAHSAGAELRTRLNNRAHLVEKA